MCMEKYWAMFYLHLKSNENDPLKNPSLKIVSEDDQEIHNHKLQTTPWHREEEPHNNHEAPGRQTKQSNQLPLPHQVDYKAGINIK